MSTPTPEALLALDDKAFEDLITRHYRRSGLETDAVWEVLVSPTVIRRTYETVGELRLRTQSVLEYRQQKLEALRAVEPYSILGRERADAARAYSATLRFAGVINEIHVDVEKALRRAGIHPPDEGNRVRRSEPALRVLVEKLLEHEEAMKEDPSEIDEELWRLLDETRVIIQGERMTLRQAHDTGW